VTPPAPAPKPKPQPKTPKPKAPEVAPAPQSALAASPPPQRSDAASFTHFRELAGRGDADAALRIAEMFETGRGVQVSNNQAYFWYAVAEKRGAAGAAGKKEAVARKLQPLEIEQMDKRARGMLSGN
jgi:TPR repeat protein